MDDARLRTVWQQRQFRDRFTPLSAPMHRLVEYTLAKRVRQLKNLANVWDEVIPDDIREHTALESLHRGTLTVLVDSASHRYQLQTLLKGGLQREIQARFEGTLNRIRLVPGQFYSIDIGGQRRYEF